MEVQLCNLFKKKHILFLKKINHFREHGKNLKPFIYIQPSIHTWRFSWFFPKSLLWILFCLSHVSFIFSNNKNLYWRNFSWLNFGLVVFWNILWYHTETILKYIPEGFKKCLTSWNFFSRDICINISFVTLKSCRLQVKEIQVILNYILMFSTLIKSL